MLEARPWVFSVDTGAAVPVPPRFFGRRCRDVQFNESLHRSVADVFLCTFCRGRARIGQAYFAHFARGAAAGMGHDDFQLAMRWQGGPGGLYRHSSSASRLTAGDAGFLILIRSFDRPNRYDEPSRFDTTPLHPSLQA
jgi:hypothetical protein